MKTFPGYDPLSPTLQPSPLGGSCMGPTFSRWKTCYTDRSVPVASGDIVRMHMHYADGTITCIVKELMHTRDGRWWGRCYDGVFQIGATGQPRTPAQPFFIEKVVALSEEPISAFWASAMIPVPKKASDAEAARYALLAAEAVREWEQHGFPIGVPFPGLTTNWRQ